MSSDRLDAGTTASQRPDYRSNPNLRHEERTPQRWFNTMRCAVPAAFKYGNAGRSILEGPGLINLDFSLLRNFRITEETRVEFRFEAFNLTNHTNFRLPGTSCLRCLRQQPDANLHRRHLRSDRFRLRGARPAVRVQAVLVGYWTALPGGIRVSRPGAPFFLMQGADAGPATIGLSKKYFNHILSFVLRSKH